MKAFFAPLALAAVLAASGCNSQPEDGPEYVAPTPAQFEETIKKIENDPNMSAQAKQSAIAGVRAAQAKASQPGKPAIGKK